MPLKPITTQDKDLQFMPVLANKRPIHLQWEQTKKEYDYSNAVAIGLVCGSISGNVEVIDIDAKYDLTGNLFSDYKKSINEMDKNLLSKLVVQKTVGGGWHFIYRCNEISGSKKLAQRHTVESEREETYKKAYISESEKLKFNTELTSDQKVEAAVLSAVKQRDNDKVRVLLETRGEKGYIACAPTPGYEIIFGSFDNIQLITPEERAILFNVAYSFNEYLKESNHDRKLPRKETKGKTPSEDFNERGDVVGLLVNHGWTEVGKRGQKILMKRPGDSKAESSGNYDLEKKWFSVFTTSTEFEAQTPYKPYAVYTMLKCGGDFTKVTKMLADEGYGDPMEVITDSKISVPSIIDMADDDMSFLATPEDSEAYLQTWRNGTFEKGKSTGLPALDDHFLFKEGNLVIINGIDNVGKSTIIWYLAMLSAIYHGWRWLIFSSENKVGGVIRKLIEFYSGKAIEQLTEEEYQLAKIFVYKHFDIIKCTDKLFNYQDILNMAAKAITKKEYKGLLIDPYNSLKVDIPAKNKQNTYEYHYEAASVIQLFGRNHNLSIYLNCHVGTNAARNKDKDGFTKAPQKEDTEMGVMFANKADEFITIHRVTQHETEFMFTELHIRKVKETETGGRVTPYHKPILLKGNKNITAFYCVPYKNVSSSGMDAVEKWRNPNKDEINQIDIFSVKNNIPMVPFHTQVDSKPLPF